MESNRNIEVGDSIMLKKSDNLRLYRITRNREINLEKTRFSLDGAIGHPFGTLFEVKDGELVKMDRAQNPELAEKDITAEERDNRNLQDSDSNQKLKQEEIEKMKKDGISGDDLVGQLIENSSTFHNKTGYAQEKWVKKKKKKHLLQFTVLKPNTRLMCEMQWSKGPSRICNLRVDSLAQMLTVGNVCANSTVMVVDSCLGLVTAAVLERLGGFGKVVSFYHGDSPNKHSLDVYDFPDNIMNSLYEFPIEQINSLKNSQPVKLEDDKIGDDKANDKAVDKDQETAKEDSNDREKVTNESVGETSSEGKGTETPTNETNDKTSDEANDKATSDQIPSDNTTDQQTAIKTECENMETDSDQGKPKATNEKSSEGSIGKRKRKDWKDRQQMREERAAEVAKARNIIVQRKVDCLLVATKFHPTPIVQALVDYLAPSRQVVVFSQFKEALQDCYVYLREHKGLVNYRLTETWLRDYQVLPNRTHPVIQMTGTGGYLLSATTIIH